MDVYFSGKWTGLDAIIEYISVFGGDFVTTPNPLSDNYFENELLRFGGINSIRGFEEKARR